jgi:hypothetical protein
MLEYYQNLVPGSMVLVTLAAAVAILFIAKLIRACIFRIAHMMSTELTFRRTMRYRFDRSVFASRNNRTRNNPTNRKDPDK